MWRIFAIVGIAAGIALPTCKAKGAQQLENFQEDLSPGKLLVASDKLGDPAFAESVILIVSRDSDQGTLGLMINHRTDVPLSKLFANKKHAGSDPVYIGGPVDVSLVQALVRSSSKIDKATRVVGDVYNTADKDPIEKWINSRADPSRFRLYLGYAGWAPGQLESEIRLGAWSVMSGSAAIVFDNHPNSLWVRLNARLHMQIVEYLQPKILVEALALRYR